MLDQTRVDLFECRARVRTVLHECMNNLPDLPHGFRFETQRASTGVRLVLVHETGRWASRERLRGTDDPRLGRAARRLAGRAQAWAAHEASLRAVELPPLPAGEKWVYKVSGSARRRSVELRIKGEAGDVIHSYLRRATPRSAAREARRLVRRANANRIANRIVTSWAQPGALALPDLPDGFRWRVSVFEANLFVHLVRGGREECAGVFRAYRTKASIEREIAVWAHKNVGKYALEAHVANSPHT